MANENQNAQAQKQEMVEIRMKPGCGRMLIGRRYLTTDGQTLEKRPRKLDEVAETEEIWCDERKMNSDGSVSDGPTVKIPLSMIASYLDKDGKPSRQIDGYPMMKVSGSIASEDEYGQAIPPVADTWKAGHVKRLQDQSLLASHQDCTFEIVRRVA
jgi:hypothetical protein